MQMGRVSICSQYPRHLKPGKTYKSENFNCKTRLQRRLLLSFLPRLALDYPHPVALLLELQQLKEVLFLLPGNKVKIDAETMKLDCG